MLQHSLKGPPRASYGLICSSWEVQKRSFSLTVILCRATYCTNFTLIPHITCKFFYLIPSYKSPPQCVIVDTYHSSAAGNPPFITASFHSEFSSCLVLIDDRRWWDAKVQTQPRTNAWGLQLRLVNFMQGANGAKLLNWASYVEILNLSWTLPDCDNAKISHFYYVANQKANWLILCTVLMEPIC